MNNEIAVETSFPCLNFFVLLMNQRGVVDKSPQLLFLNVYENYLINPLIYLFVADQQTLLVKSP